MSGLVERIEQNILNQELLKAGQKVIVAVSGGVDSTVLVTVLHWLSVRHGWRLVVAHFNHRLRGRSSDADGNFVRSLAKRLGLPCVGDRAEVKRLADAEGLSIEMAARKLRHEFLAQTARQRRISSIALAHHADDQVELLFLRLFRGAGSEGLSGMKWKGPSPVDAKVRLIRPLLNISKRELEEFARVEKISFREDATNGHVDFERNRVRHKLLPLLRCDFASSLDRTVLRAMEIVGAEAEFTAEAARVWLAKPAVSEFEWLHVAVQRRVVHEQLLKLGTALEFELIERLRLNADKKIVIAPGRAVWRDARGIIRVGKESADAGFNSAERRVRLSGKSGVVEFDGCVFRWRVASRVAQVRREPRTLNRECFDAERVGVAVVLRHWRPGDRFQPIGLAKRVKLQDWFVNQKILRARRHQLIVAATEQGEIFWVEGCRIGEAGKLTSQTKAALEWHWMRTES